MVELCRQHGIHLLCYGTLAGGFLSDRWLGQPSPATPLANRSLMKYRLIIEEFGGWPALQRVLDALARIAARRGDGVAAVATAWVLRQPQVAAAIVGARHAGHRAAAARAGMLRLGDDEVAEIADAVASLRARAW